MKRAIVASGWATFLCSAVWRLVVHLQGGSPPLAVVMVMAIALVASAFGVTRLGRGTIGRPIGRSTRVEIMIAVTALFLAMIVVAKLSYPATMTLERLSDVGGVGLGLWCLGWVLATPVSGERVRP